MSSQVVFTEEASTPATPAAGRLAVYAKTDSKLYKLDDTGAETEVGSTAGLAGVGLAIAMAVAL